MRQGIKITIRWQNAEGNVLGAFCEKEIELPRWGKKAFLRHSIVELILDLLDCSKCLEGKPAQTFSDFAYKAFRLDSIIQCKAKTVGSYLNLKGKDLESFISERFRGGSYGV